MPRFALRAVQAGAVAVVLAAAPLNAFDLDRFFVPKELVLHLTALLAGVAILLLRAAPGPAPVAAEDGGPRRDKSVDRWLLLYLAISVISAVFATNHWVALRAVAISASSIALFWIARTVNDRRVLDVIGIAVILAAVTSLVQAYGVRLDIFATSRAPGGTLGNRNFVAHIAAFGLPVLFSMRNRIALPGIALVSAALVLTRSRGAWLATAAMLVVYVIASSWNRRLFLLLGAAAAGVVAALLIPNALRWNSDNPYLESVHDVANYQQGSGRGRLVQYQRSLNMTLHHPLLGVGPGNWPVVYPAYAPRNDPSLNPDHRGMTYNPWPSSDWIAVLSERGPLAVICLLMALLGIARRGDATTLALLAGVLVAGLFDAVLLLAVPSFLAWTALGATVGTGFSLSEGGLKPAPTFALLLSLAGGVYSAGQLGAITTYPRAVSSLLDPGNYKIHMHFSRRCGHAKAAHALFPTSVEAANLSRGCR